MSRSKLDPNQIMQTEHDDISGAKKVKVVDTEMNIEVNADDGDSVQVQPRVFEYTPASLEEVDITSCREVKVYSSGSIVIEISPDISGSNWIQIDSSTNVSPILPVLARRLRVTSLNPIKILGRG